MDTVFALHRRIVSDVRQRMAQSTPDELIAEVHRPHVDGDVSLAIDEPAERVLVEEFSRRARLLPPVTIVAEGIAEITAGSAEGPPWRILVDPLDGSRELAKGRPAWVLTGIAPDRGAGTTLADIVAAVQTEVPPERQSRALVLWAVRGRGARRRTLDLASGDWLDDEAALRIDPPSTVRGGVVGVADHFPGAREIQGALLDHLFVRALGPPRRGDAQVFFDAYICSGGCLAALALGQYRLHIDVRPQVDAASAAGGRSVGLCAKPYDLCTALIAQEAGVIVTTPAGGPLAYPFDLTTDCGWIGYAGDAIRAEVEPALRQAMDALSLLGQPSP